jgi:hypothetical protein
MSYQPEEFAGLPHNDSRSIVVVLARAMEEYMAEVLPYMIAGERESSDAHITRKTPSSS